MPIRNPPLVGSPLQSGCLTKYRTYSSYAALATFPRVIAGHNRLYFEMLTGQTIGIAGAGIDENQPACSPKNARGIIGEDHSGNGLGAALKHSFWEATWPCGSTVPTDVGNQCYIGRISGDGTYDAVGLEKTFEVFVPAAHGQGPYSDVEVRVIIYVSTGYALATAYLDISSVSEFADATQLDFNISSNDTWKEDSATIAVKPGEINKIKMKFYTTTAITCSVYLSSITLSQTN